MADTLTNIATVGNAVQAEYWQKVFLSTLEANLLFDRFGLPAELPAHEGKNVFWPRFENISMTVSAQSTASEGKDPDAAAVSVNVVSAAMDQYKQWYRLSDLWSSQNLAGTNEALVERMAYRGALTVDTAIRNNVFTAGGSVQFAGTAVAQNSMKKNSTFYMDIAEIRESVKTLKNANVPVTENGLYVGVLHPEPEYDLQGDSNWTDIVKYTTEGINRAFQGRTGAAYGVDFYISTQALEEADGASAAASANTYQTYVFGDEYFGLCKPHGVEVIIKDPFPGSPLNSYAAYGWKLWMAAKELKSTRMVRIESTSSFS